MDVSGLAFLSLVYPGKKWSVGFYRHELTNFRAEYESQGPLFRLPPDHPTLPDQDLRLGAARGDIDLDITNVGASVAYELKKLSLGIGVSYYRFLLKSQISKFQTRNFEDSLDRRIADGGIYGPANFSDANRTWTASEEGDDTDWGINLGFLWKVHEDLTIGGNYRQGPDFDMVRRFRPKLLSLEDDDDATRFHVPDLYCSGHCVPSLAQSTNHVRLRQDRILAAAAGFDQHYRPRGYGGPTFRSRDRRFGRAAPGCRVFLSERQGTVQHTLGRLARAGSQDALRRRKPAKPSSMAAREGRDALLRRFRNRYPEIPIRRRLRLLGAGHGSVRFDRLSVLAGSPRSA